jgi:hypothetical protein
MLADIDFSALLEGRAGDRDLNSFRFFAGCSFLLYDVDARRAAIAFDAKARRIARKPGIL